MTTILHLAKHDLRSQRLVLLACVAFAVVDAFLATTVLPYDVARAMGVRTSSVLAGLRITLLVLATGLVLQQDALVGTTAFWRTRPIARHVLMVSKALTLGGGLVILPGLLQWAAWYRLGLYAGDASVVAGAYMVDNATVVLLAAMAAVVTPSFTYLVVAGVAGGTMVTVLNGYLLPVLMTSWPFVGETLQNYRPALYLGTLFVLGVPAVAYQFLRMRDWHTAALVAMALLSATLVTRFWPAGSARAPYPPIAHAIVDPQRVVITLGEQNGRWEVPVRDATRRVQQMAQYAVPTHVSGQPAAVKLWADRIESRLLLRDRTVTTTTQAGQLVPADTTPATHPTHLSLQAAVWPARLAEPVGQRFSAPVSGTPIARVPLDLDRAYAGSLVLLTADVDVLATRTRIVGQAPARAGSRLQRHGRAAEVLSVSSDGQRITVRVRAVTIGALVPSDYRIGSQGSLVLRNASRREAVRAGGPQTSRFSWSFSSSLGISGLRAMVNEYASVCSAPDGWTLDAAWLAGAEVLATEDEAVGTFTRSAQTTLRVGKD